MTDSFVNKAHDLLRSMISIPSYSGEEDRVADFLVDYLREMGYRPKRKANNLWVQTNFDASKPTLLLNSHIDTVRPVSGWTEDPFKSSINEEKIIGLGSNDAGASLVSLLFTFHHFSQMTELPWNLIFLASAEEEVSGENGVILALKELAAIDFAVVGEPTGMQIAVAEKGLCVVDGLSKGKSGHAARDEGENAIYYALDDINKIRNFSFPKVSALLGPVKLSVSEINAGTQHNVVPDECHFVVDIRSNEYYNNQEIVEILQKELRSDLKARSFRLNSSGLETTHAAWKRAVELSIPVYGSPTLSDQALMPFASIKMGPGDSARSHTANEYIYQKEIKAGILGYIDFLTGLKL